MEPQVSTMDNLDNFIDFLYSGLEGYVYVAAMKPNKPDTWKQMFIEYPAEAAKVKSIIRGTSGAGEVFISPALFKDPSGGAERGNFKASNVVWADFDGNAPEWDSLITHPSVVIQSSKDENQHVYWRLQEPLYSVDQVEDINRRIQTKYLADPSCWPAVHVLRPPDTTNHKRGTDVKLVYSDSISYDIDVFGSLPAITVEESPQFTLGVLPDFEDVVLNYRIPPDLKLLLKKSRDEVKDRSASLMNAAYICCESGMSDVECFVILKYLDNEWEKFSGRKDQDKQLGRIVMKARQRHPDVLPSPQDEEENAALGDNPLLLFGYEDFLATEVTIDYVVEGMLMEQGNMLLAGPSGIGKSQVTLQWMKHIALGKDFLGYTIPAPKKCGFLSLEMGHGELRVFMDRQDKDLVPDERALLTKNLEIVPWGEAFPLNIPVFQEQLMYLIENRGWEGVFVDSIGSAILGNINSQEVVQNFTNFNDRIRKKFGVFLWYIHHTRKPGQGQGGSIDQNDIYGDQYLVNRCTSAYGILPGKDGTIKVRNFKNRLSPKEADYLLDRTDNLNFVKVSGPINMDGESLSEKIFSKDKNKPDSTAPGGMEL